MKKQELIKFVTYANNWAKWLSISPQQAAELMTAVCEKKKKLYTIFKDKSLKNKITQQYHENKIRSWVGVEVIFEYSQNGSCECLTTEVEWLDKNTEGLGIICPFC